MIELDFFEDIKDFVKFDEDALQLIVRVIDARLKEIVMSARAINSDGAICCRDVDAVLDILGKKYILITRLE